MNLNVRAVAVLSAMLVLVACGGESATTLLTQAKSSLEKKEPKSAIIQLKNALQQDANLVEARFLLGKALLESGDPAGALIELGKARDQGYPADEVAPRIASALLFKGEPDRVILEYGQVELKSAPRNSELRAALATAYAAKGQMAQARNALDVALRDDPANISARLLDVRLLASEGDLNAAERALDQLLKEHPQHSIAWALKGDMLTATKGDSTGEAVAAYQHAIDADKRNLQAYVALLDLRIQAADFAGANKQLDALKAQYPRHPQVSYYGGVLALERKDLPSATEQVQAVLKVMPDNWRALHLAGAIDMQSGNLVQAASNLGKALQVNPSSAPIRVMLAKTYVQLADPDKALNSLQPLLEAKGAQPAEVYSVAAQAFMQRGDKKSAEALLTKSVKLNPKDGRGRTALALSQFEAGKAEQGFDTLRAISADDVGTTADIAMINLLVAKRDFGQALQAIEVLDRKRVGEPLAPTLRGKVEMALGNHDRARQSFEDAMKRSPTYVPAAVSLGALDVQDKKPELAVLRLEKLLQASPDAIEARMALISFQAQAGASPPEVLGKLDTLVKKYPKEPAPLMALINAHLEAKDPAKALAGARDGVARFPSNANFLDLLGRSQLAGGDTNQALQAYSKMAALQPNSTLPAMRSAAIYASLKDNTNAISQLKKALTIHPDHVPAIANMVALLTSSGNVAEARSQVQKLQTSKPEEALGWVLAGDIEVSQKNYAAAISAYRSGLKKTPSTDVAIRLHRALDAHGKPDEARVFADTWLGSHAKDAPFRSYLGDYALVHAQFALAEQRFREVVELQPDNAVALNNMAWLLNKSRKAGALEYAERAVRLHPKEAAFLDTQAEIHAAMGQSAQALEVQRRAVALRPDLPAHRLHLARYLIASDKKVEAKAELTRLVELGDRFPAQSEVKKLLASL